MDDHAPFTWRDPRTCTPEQFGGPLATEIVADSADHLEDLCAEIGSQVLLDQPMVQPSLAWSDFYGFVELVPDFDAGLIRVRSGGHEAAVGARPVRPIEVGRAMFDLLGREPLSQVSASDDFLHHFCGTGRVMLRGSYRNAGDHPLTGDAAYAAAHGDEDELDEETGNE